MEALLASLAEQQRATGSGTFLIKSRFTDNWCNDARWLLGRVADAIQLRPVVLLPTDIQLDEYVGDCETVFGVEANNRLRSLSGLSWKGAPVFYFVDLAPDPFPDHTGFVGLLNAALENGLGEGAVMVVYSPSMQELAVQAFDQAFGI